MEIEAESCTWFEIKFCLSLAPHPFERYLWPGLWQELVGDTPRMHTLWQWEAEKSTHVRKGKNRVRGGNLAVSMASGVVYCGVAYYREGGQYSRP